MLRRTSGGAQAPLCPASRHPLGCGCCAGLLCLRPRRRLRLPPLSLAVRACARRAGVCPTRAHLWWGGARPGLRCGCPWALLLGSHAQARGCGGSAPTRPLVQRHRPAGRTACSATRVLAAGQQAEPLCSVPWLNPGLLKPMCPWGDRVPGEIRAAGSDLDFSYPRDHGWRVPGTRPRIARDVLVLPRVRLPLSRSQGAWPSPAPAHVRRRAARL